MTRATCIAVALALVSVHAYAECQLQKVAELQVPTSSGRPVVEASINGVDARLQVDSGAFMSAIFSERAAPYQLQLEPLPPGLRVWGIGGEVAPQVTHVKDFALKNSGLEPIHEFAFLVFESNLNLGLDGSIGQDLLRKYDVEYDLRRGVMRLFTPTDCDRDAAAYWHEDAKVAELRMTEVSEGSPHLGATATLNDVTIALIFDTGSPSSLLTEAAAIRAGVPHEIAHSRRGGHVWGFGSQETETWITRFDKIDFGGELIRKPRLRVASVELGNDAELLLGLDFFLSHRVYVATGQQRIYFTYEGGKVFDLSYERKKRQPGEEVRAPWPYDRSRP